MEIFHKDFSQHVLKFSFVKFSTRHQVYFSFKETVLFLQKNFQIEFQPVCLLILISFGPNKMICRIICKCKCMALSIYGDKHDNLTNKYLTNRVIRFFTYFSIDWSKNKNSHWISMGLIMNFLVPIDVTMCIKNYKNS